MGGMWDITSITSINSVPLPLEIIGVPLGALVPSGLIVLFNDVDTSIPAGWTRFSAADGKFIVGSGGGYSVGNNGSGTDIGTITSSTDGAHTGTNLQYMLASGAAPGSGNRVGFSLAGGHSHSINASYTPSFDQLLLIKSDSEKTKLPQKAVVLSASTLSGLDGVSPNNKMFKSGSTLTSGGSETISGVSSTNGVHRHSADFNYGVIAGGSSYRDQPIGDHSHNAAVTVTNTLKRFWLSAWTRVLSDFPVTGGMIAMWESLIPPLGWYLCDGSNGTPDLRDYFIILSDTANHGTYSGSGGCSYSGSLVSTSWIHDHVLSTVNAQTTTDRWGHRSESITHSHVFSGTAASFLPPYYSLAFIKKA